MAKKIIDVYDLKDIPNLGPISIEKLEMSDITSKRDILVFGWKELADITGMERTKAEESVEYCRKVLIEAGDQWDSEMTAYEILEKRKTLKHIPTGSKALDELLDGGVEARAITEFAGKFGSAKTQISHSLTVTALADETMINDKGVPPMVLYFDTEGTVRPDRMNEMALLRKLYDPAKPDALKNFLGRVIVQKADDPPQLVMKIESASHLMQELNIRLVIVDSGTALFRQMMPEMGDAGRKFRLLNKMVHRLKNLAEVHNVPVVFINQMYDSTDQYNPGPKQYGGNVVGHAMTYRVVLKKKSKVWSATAVDFPNKPVQDIEFLVTKAGITDVKGKIKPPRELSDAEIAEVVSGEVVALAERKDEIRTEKDEKIAKKKKKKSDSDEKPKVVESTEDPETLKHASKIIQNIEKHEGDEMQSDEEGDMDIEPDF